MVLVDTSVWIRGFAGVAPYSVELAKLLHVDEVAGHQLIYGELLIGDMGGRQKVLADYLLRHQVPMVPHDDVAGFVRQHRLHGRGIGWIDAHLLASALADRVQFWTADTQLADFARQFHVAYIPTP